MTFHPHSCSRSSLSLLLPWRRDAFSCRVHPPRHCVLASPFLGGCPGLTQECTEATAVGFCEAGLCPLPRLNRKQQEAERVRTMTLSDSYTEALNSMILLQLTLTWISFALELQPCLPGQRPPLGQVHCFPSSPLLGCTALFSQSCLNSLKLYVLYF